VQESIPFFSLLFALSISISADAIDVCEVLRLANEDKKLGSSQDSERVSALHGSQQ